MRPVRLDELREKVRVRYDLDEFSTQTFITTDIVNELINESVQNYYALLMNTREEEFYTYEETLSAPADASSVSLGSLADAVFVDVRAVHWLRSADDVVPLEVGDIDDLHLRSQSSQAWTTATKYRIVRDRIYWLPVPRETYTVRIWYVGTPGALTADDDTIDGGPGWEQWVVLDVCSKIADREEKDPSVWEAKRADHERRILGQMQRHKSEAKQARDRRGARERVRRRPFPWWPTT